RSQRPAGGGTHDPESVTPIRPGHARQAHGRRERPAGRVPHRVHDARRRGLHAPGDRGRARRHRRHVQGAAQPRPRQAPRRAGRVCGGMEIMTDTIDFGPDDKLPPMSDAEFDAWITRVAPTLNAPNATPRSDMWKVIEAAAKTSSDAQAGRIPGVT